MPGTGPGQGPGHNTGTPFVEGDAHNPADAALPAPKPPGHRSPATAFRGRPEPHTMGWDVPRSVSSLSGGTAVGTSVVLDASLSIEGELPYADIVITYDDTHVLNDVRITRAGGTIQTATDATSQAAYLKRTFERTDVHTETDADSLYAAQFLLGRYKDPHLRIEKLVVKPQRDPNKLWPVVLSLEIGDIITVLRRPQAIGSAITQRVVIEGIAHDVTPEFWVTTYQLGPMPPQGWVLGHPVYSVLGSTTRLYA